MYGRTRPIDRFARDMTENEKKMRRRTVFDTWNDDEIARSTRSDTTGDRNGRRNGIYKKKNKTVERTTRSKRVKREEFVPRTEIYRRRRRRLRV